MCSTALPRRRARGRRPLQPGQHACVCRRQRRSAGAGDRLAGRARAEDAARLDALVAGRGAPEMVGRAAADRREPCPEPHGVDGADAPRDVAAHALGHGAEGLLPPRAHRRSLGRPALVVRRRRRIAQVHRRTDRARSRRGRAAAAPCAARLRRSAGSAPACRARGPMVVCATMDAWAGHVGAGAVEGWRRGLSQRHERSWRHCLGEAHPDAGRDRFSGLRGDHAARRADAGGRRRSPGSRRSSAAAPTTSPRLPPAAIRRVRRRSSCRICRASARRSGTSPRAARSPASTPRWARPSSPALCSKASPIRCAGCSRRSRRPQPRQRRGCGMPAAARSRRSGPDPRRRPRPADRPPRQCRLRGRRRGDAGWRGGGLFATLEEAATACAGSTGPSSRTAPGGPRRGLRPLPRALRPARGIRRPRGGASHPSLSLANGSAHRGALSRNRQRMDRRLVRNTQLRGRLEIDSRDDVAANNDRQGEIAKEPPFKGGSK